MGLYDGKTRTLYELRLKNLGVLVELEPKLEPVVAAPLDVAILQRYLLDEVITQHFAPGGPTKAYTADASQIVPQVDGTKNQTRPCCFSPPRCISVEELGRHNELMPQKSTYFYPKLATGMVIHSLR